MSKDLALYVHIPFCKQKCLYCDFVSEPGDGAKMARYLKALKEEITKTAPKAKDYVVKSVFFGGGTPTVLSAESIEEIMTLLKIHYPLAPDAEVTIEANPESLTMEKAKVYRKCGINRVSIGLQAWQEHLLKRLGRIHNRETFLKSYRTLREAGFQNINVDLMFGLPEQSMADWQETLREVIALSPEHLSCYSLILEENTPLYQQNPVLPDEDLTADMYELTRETLESHGYHQYEVSNFSKPGHACRHNIVYWDCKPYLGFGAAAHSYFDGERYAHHEDLEAYISAPLMKLESEHLSTEDMENEFFLLGLRKTEGVSLTEFESRFGHPFDTVRLQRYAQLGLLEIKDNQMRITHKGFPVSNQILMEFVSCT